MVTSIAGSLRSLGWTLVLLLLMIYVFSVILTMLISDHGVWDADAKQAAAKYYYGSMFRAILSLFQAITGGADWDEMVSPLIDCVSPFTGVLFLLYVAFAVLAMMNVVTAVFVESAMGTANLDKEQHLVQQLRQLFVTVDEDESGMISWEEFEHRLDDDDMAKYFKALELDVCEAKGLFTLLDVDNLGEILIEEFVSGCLRLRGGAKAIDLATLMYYNKRMSSNMRAHSVYMEEMLEDMMEQLEEASGLIRQMPQKDENVELGDDVESHQLPVKKSTSMNGQQQHLSRQGSRCRPTRDEPEPPLALALPPPGRVERALSLSHAGSSRERSHSPRPDLPDGGGSLRKQTMPVLKLSNTEPLGSKDDVDKKLLPIQPVTNDVADSSQEFNETVGNE